jgi:hypothetical protein
MFDLQLVAFQSDLTRVTTFMMGREQTDRPYREIGIGDGHHPLSHHKEVAETMAMVEKIDRYQTEVFSYFMEKMRDTPDGNGSLLDHSIILFGSSLSDANYHIHNDVPIVVAGGAAGQLNGQPLSNLHLTVLDMLKVPATEFVDNEYSDATGKLEHLSIA